MTVRETLIELSGMEVDAFQKYAKLLDFNHVLGKNKKNYHPINMCVTCHHVVDRLKKKAYSNCNCIDCNCHKMP